MNVRFYHEFRCMHLYTKKHILWSDQVVSYISACIQLFGCKCMHQYTKHLYAKLSSNFEILKVKIDTQALYDNSKRCSTQWDYIKTMSFFLKRIEPWNSNFVPGIFLLDGRFENLWHALIHEANQFFLSPKNGKFWFT